MVASIGGIQTPERNGIVKIVCLIQESAPLIYFANAIHQHHAVEAVVIERPVAKFPLWKRLLKMGPRKAVARLFQKIRPVNSESEAIYQLFFGDDWRRLKCNQVSIVDSVNSPELETILCTIQPDLMLVHGTKIVHDRILSKSRLSLNLHWGLSPYYRGTYCTNWALINWDPYNIGVTIHSLSSEIDGGGIVAQQRVEVETNDNVESVNMKLTQTGTELCKQIISKFSKGESLVFHKQDFSKGYVTFLRQWTENHDKLIHRIETTGQIARMLRHPARIEKLPIIELD